MYKKVLFGLLLSAFAIMPFTGEQVSAAPQDNNIAWNGGGWNGGGWRGGYGGYGGYYGGYGGYSPYYSQPFYSGGCTNCW
jgi:hypothetical protein